jgi:hypothetical protein
MEPVVAREEVEEVVPVLTTDRERRGVGGAVGPAGLVDAHLQGDEPHGQREAADHGDEEGRVDLALLTSWTKRHFPKPSLM